MTTLLADAADVIGRSFALSIAVKATAALVLGLGAARLAGRARASVRHLALAATFLALLALPAVAMFLPAVEIELPASQAVASGRTADGASASIGADATASTTPIMPVPDALATGAGPSWSIATWLLASWLGGTAILFGLLLRALGRVAAFRREGLPWLECRALADELAAEAGLQRRVSVVLHEGVAAPFTAGVVRPAILMPIDARGWSEADVRRVLVHELEHVRRGDWVVQLAARAACTLYWPHPLVWVAWRRMCLEAERACDDAVLRSAGQADYAEQLVTLAHRLKGGPASFAPAMAARTDLSTRVRALLDPDQRRGRAGRLATVTTAIVALAMVLGVAPVRASRAAAGTGSTAGAPGASTAPSQRPSSLDRSLLRAAERGDVTRLAERLDAGANVNAAIDGDGTALIVAAREGHLAAVRLLLDRGADVNLPVAGDGNPLIMAARKGHLAAVRLLLDRGADVNLAVAGDGNPLIRASHDGHLPVVDLLLQRGANVNQVVPEDETALIQASAAGELEVVKLLVARGADLNLAAWAVTTYDDKPEGEWRTALGEALRRRHDVVAAFLRSAGAKQ